MGDTRGDELTVDIIDYLGSLRYFPSNSISNTSGCTSLIGDSKRNEKDEKEIRIN